MSSEVTKTCCACGVSKPVEAFYVRRKSADGYTSRCKSCRPKQPKEQKLKASRMFYQRHKDKRNKDPRHREAKKKYWHESNGAALSTQLKSRYGITLEQYNETLKLQNGTCAICYKEETMRHNATGKIRKLAVDHCHSTGKVRGLLCNSCNTMLGKMKDSIQALESAIEYLKKHQD